MKETVYFLPAHERASIAFLADTHNIDPYSIVASLKAHHLDIITISGDILIGRRPVNDELIVETQDNVLPLISNCVSIAPTFISLGNHEWMISFEDVEVLERAGATVLDNRFVSYTCEDKVVVVLHEGYC